jgi:hypothetical protein
MALGSVATEASKPAGPSTAQASFTYDNSGFVVNVGSGSAASSKTSLPTASQAVQAVAAGAGSLLANPIFIIGVGLALFLYLKHK